MKYIFYIWIFLIVTTGNAQLNTGTINVPSINYPTIAVAIDSINNYGLSVQLFVEVASGHSENSPVGGIILQYNPSVPVSKHSSVSKSITIRKSGGGINPVIYAYTGTKTGSSTNYFDGIFSIVGVDYVSIIEIDLMENGTNNNETTWMEYGYGIFRENNTNGSQNIGISQSNITLNKNNPAAWSGGSGMVGTAGVVSIPMTRTSTTILTSTGGTTSGTNSDLQIDQNNIRNVTNGIFIRGINDSSPFLLYDQNNNCTANVIENFISKGIYVIYQNYILFRNNYIDNDAAGGAASSANIYGIHHSTSTNSSFDALDNEIFLNMGSINGGAFGLQSDVAGTGSINMDGNLFSFSGGNIANAITYRAIYIGSSVTSLTDLYITNNYFYDWNIAMMNNATYGASYFFNNGTAFITNLTFSGNITSGTTTPYINVTAGNNLISVYGFVNSNNTNAAGTLNVTNNNFSYVNGGEVNTSYMFNESSGGASNTIIKNISNNTISNCTFTSGIFIGISASKGYNNFTLANNNIHTISGANVIWGFNITTNSNVNCYGNSIYTFNANNSFRGIYTSSGTYGYIYSNEIYNLSAINSGPSQGILNENVLAGQTISVHDNLIYSLSSSCISLSSTGGLKGIEIGCQAGGFSSVYNNLIADITHGDGGTLPSIEGMRLKLGTHSVYHNTIALGYGTILTGSGTNFGAAGMVYQSNTTSLDARNNILYVNATPLGNGTVSAMQRVTGTSGTAPSNFAATSNYNVYYTPNSSNCYLYSENTTVSSPIVNGYNSTNDPDFNRPNACSNYKTFMTTANEDSTYTEISPFIGSGSIINKYHLQNGMTSFCESGGQLLASVTNDYVSAVRGNASSLNRPDIGFREFTGTKQTPIPCTPLPIEIFHLEVINGDSNVELKWITQNEINNDYFTIEKSNDLLYWNRIGIKEGAGTIVATIAYNFLDDSQIAGLNYYRIKQTDYNGEFSYSNIVWTEIKESASFKIYPIPSNDYITVNTNNSAISFEYKIFDLTGNLVQTGSAESSISLLELPSGIYLLEIYYHSGIIEKCKIIKE